MACDHRTPKFCMFDYGVRLAHANDFTHGQHCCIDCQHCLSKNSVLLSTFPLSSKFILNDVKKNPVSISQLSKKKIAKAGRSGLKECLQEVVKNLNSSMEERFDRSFENTFCSMNNLISKPNKSEKIKNKRSCFREVKGMIEDTNVKSAVDRTLGTNTSFCKWDKMRGMKNKELKSDAIKRFEKNDDAIQNGLKKP